MSDYLHWRKVNGVMDDSLEARQRPVPNIPKDLIEDLDRRFPHRCPRPEDPERGIWIYSGKRELVEFLKEAYRRQVEDSLRGSVVQ